MSLYNICTSNKLIAFIKCSLNNLRHIICYCEKKCKFCSMQACWTNKWHQVSNTVRLGLYKVGSTKTMHASTANTCTTNTQRVIDSIVESSVCWHRLLTSVLLKKCCCFFLFRFSKYVERFVVWFIYITCPYTLNNIRRKYSSYGIQVSYCVLAYKLSCVV